MPEDVCKQCKLLLERAEIAALASARAIDHLDKAVWENPQADFHALEAEVNTTRIDYQHAKDQYQEHMASHQKAMGSGAG